MTTVDAWINAMLGRIMSNGVLVELEGAINFVPPLVATRNVGQGRIDVTVDAEALGGGSPTLADVLAEGNTTGASDIVLSAGRKLTSPAFENVAIVPLPSPTSGSGVVIMGGAGNAESSGHGGTVQVAGAAGVGSGDGGLAEIVGGGGLVGGVVRLIAGNSSGEEAKGASVELSAGTGDEGGDVELAPGLGGTTNGRVKIFLPSGGIITFPDDVGAAGQVLSTDGAGNLSWITP